MTRRGPSVWPMTSVAGGPAPGAGVESLMIFPWVSSVQRVCGQSRRPCASTFIGKFPGDAVGYRPGCGITPPGRQPVDALHIRDLRLAVCIPVQGHCWTINVSRCWMLMVAEPRVNWRSASFPFRHPCAAPHFPFTVAQIFSTPVLQLKETVPLVFRDPGPWRATEFRPLHDASRSSRRLPRPQIMYT